MSNDKRLESQGDLSLRFAREDHPAEHEMLLAPRHMRAQAWGWSWQQEQSQVICAPANDCQGQGVPSGRTNAYHGDIGVVQTFLSPLWYVSPELTCSSAAGEEEHGIGQQVVGEAQRHKQQAVGSSLPSCLFNSPHDVHRGILDPFQTYPSTLSPEFVNRCFTYCECHFSVAKSLLRLVTDLSVLSPMLSDLYDGQGNLYTHSWFSVITSDPTLCSACLFASLLHRRTRWLLGGMTSELLQPQDQRWLNLCYRNAIEMINKSIQSSAQNVTDTIILSTLMVSATISDEPGRDWNKGSPFKATLRSLQWLDVHGALMPNTSNVQGLLTMIKIQGGLENIKLPGLSAIISL
jgi:hypothetical protein